jgi:hypothetical protein
VQAGSDDRSVRACAAFKSAVDLFASGGPSSDRNLRALVEQGHPGLPAVLASAVAGRQHVPGLLRDVLTCARLGRDDELRLVLNVCDASAAGLQQEGASCDCVSRATPVCSIRIFISS